MSDDVLVRVENVSKRFCRSLKRSLWYGLQDLGSELGGRRHGGGAGLPQSSADVELRKDEFWAVKDVTFELRRGECLGLIGRNGAGKTTLLRMLNGLIKPDTGRIEMMGRVGALIALGAGFNPVLTGRENIFINASILGLQVSDIEQVFDDIVEFSGLKEFIDTPVQSYSSGMTVRLGFAIASSLKPEVLIIDEVLAVGDTEFRMKCFNRIYELSSSAAIIIVSHSMPQVLRVASHIMPMRRGATTGKTSDIGSAINKYFAENQAKSNPSLIFSKAHIKNIAINGIYTGNNGMKIPRVTYLDSLELTFDIFIDKSCAEFNLHLGIVDGEANTIAQCFSKANGVVFKNDSDITTISVRIPKLLLANGRYTLNINAVKHREGKVSGDYLAHFRGAAEFEVVGYPFSLQTPVQFDAIWQSYTEQSPTFQS